MTSDKTDSMFDGSDARFLVEVPDPNHDYFEDTVRHIADTTITPEYEPLGFVSDDDRVRINIRSEQVLCSRGRFRSRYGEVPVSEAVSRLGKDFDTFVADPPDDICSKCWKKAREQIETERQSSDKPIGDVGYRLRWKQKGRAREEWYDIIVRPTATFEHLDTEIRTFSTIWGDHLRGYDGGSDEILPDRQHDVAGHRNQTKASTVTIGDVAEALHLWIGDRIEMECDFGTPSHYYGIVKDVLTDEEITALLHEMDDVDETTQAFKIKYRKSPDGSITTADAWPPETLEYAEESNTTTTASSHQNQSEANDDGNETDPSEYIGGVGSGENNSDYDPVEEWSITDQDQ